MKKVILGVFAVLSAFIASACDTGNTLVLFNWGEYINPDLVTAFETQTGIRVNQVFFDSNEVAVSQALAGNHYDLIVPSDYAIEQLIVEDHLQPIDWEKVTTFDRETDIADSLKIVLDKLKNEANGYDLLEYAVPYMWGNFALLYNTLTVDEADLEAGWNVLKNTDYKVSIYASAREGFMVAFKALGLSANTTSVSDWDAAKAWLQNLLDIQGNNVSVIGDQILDDMVAPGSELYDISVAYSGDAVFLTGENENLAIYTPADGTNVWVDGFVLPKDSNTELAYQFINFMMTYENNLSNTEFIGYTTPRQDVMEFVLSDEGPFAGYGTNYDIQVGSNDEVYRFIPALKVAIESRWSQLLT